MGGEGSVLFEPVDDTFDGVLARWVSRSQNRGTSTLGASAFPVGSLIGRACSQVWCVRGKVSPISQYPIRPAAGCPEGFGHGDGIDHDRGLGPVSRLARGVVESEYFTGLV